MKTTLFTFFILAMFGAGAWLKWGDKANIQFLSDDKQSLVAPLSEWKLILQGTWDYSISYEAPTFSCYDEGEVEYRSDGTYSRYSTLKQSHKESPGSSGYLWRLGGGKIEGIWEIDTLNSSAYEIIGSCNIKTTWIKNGWTENYGFCDSYYTNNYYIGNTNLEHGKRWLEQFNDDYIIAKGKDFSSDMNFTMYLKKRH